MALVKFKSDAISVNDKMETEVHSVGRDWIVLEAYPETKITLGTSGVTSLNTKPGDKISVEKIADGYQISSKSKPAAKPSASTPRGSGSAQLFTRSHPLR